jgi:epsilon-lactone hydrolase
MPSVASSISLLGLKLTRYQSYLSSAEALQKHIQSHFLKADHAPSQKLHRYYKIERGHCRGRDVYTMQSKNSPEMFTHIIHIMYIHGGAYVNEITLRQWEFLGTIVEAAAHQGIQIVFTIPIYSIISPQVQALNGGHGHAHAVMGFLKAVYRSMVDKVGRSGEIQIMGDEAGGGLAYALAVALDNRSGLIAPRRVLLLSPWLDLALQNPAIKHLERTDPTNRLEGLREAGRQFALGTEADDPLLNPLFARCDKSLLTRTYVWTSDADVCQADCVALVYLASKKGIDMTKPTKTKSQRYYCMGGLYPSWMFATWTPEARKTVSEVVQVIKEGVINQRSPILGEDERRKSCAGHLKGRSWSSGSVNARARARSIQVQSVWGIPDVPPIVQEPLPWKAAIPQY